MFSAIVVYIPFHWDYRFYLPADTVIRQDYNGLAEWNNRGVNVVSYISRVFNFAISAFPEKSRNQETRNKHLDLNTFSVIAYLPI